MTLTRIYAIQDGLFDKRANHNLYKKVLKFKIYLPKLDVERQMANKIVKTVRFKKIITNKLFTLNQIILELKYYNFNLKKIYTCLFLSINFKLNIFIRFELLYWIGNFKIKIKFQ